MVTIQPSRRPSRILVTFELPAGIWADRVSVCGDFNGWDPAVTPMARDRRTGSWRATVELEATRSSTFQYLVDGTIRNSDGSANGLIGGTRDRRIVSHPKV